MEINSPILKDTIHNLAPSSDLTVSEWGAKYRVMTQYDSPAAGQLFDNNRVPYTVGIMDSFSQQSVRMIVFKAGTQIGKTNMMMNMLGWVASEKPGPTMLALPTKESVDRFSSARIDPMFKASPKLKPLQQKKWRTQQKHFNGGVLYLATSNSSAQMSSASVEYVFADELKDWKSSVNTGGSDAVKYLLDRQKTFPYTKKAVLVSSPSGEESMLEKYYDACEVKVQYHVRCPKCQYQHVLKFENIDFGEEYFPFDVPREKDNSDYWAAARKHACYICPECSHRITDYMKPKMNRAGEWLTEDGDPIPKDAVSIGFQLSSLYSQDLKWGDIVFEFLESRQDRHKLENFITGWLGECWTNDVVATSEEELRNNIIDLDPVTAPVDTIAITAGIDCQATHFYFSVWAWNKAGDGTMIHHGMLNTFEEVSDLVHTNEYPILGTDETMQIWRASIDTGGGMSTNEAGMEYSMTDAAYRFVREHSRGKIFAVKGNSVKMAGRRVQMSMLDKFPNGKAMPGGLALYLLNTEEFKETLFWRFAREEGEQNRLVFNKDVDKTWFAHLTAEKKVLNDKDVWEWKQVKKRNDYLDTCVYNLALIDPQFGGGLKVLGNKRASLNKSKTVQDQMAELNHFAQQNKKPPAYNQPVRRRISDGWHRR